VSYRGGNPEINFGIVNGLVSDFMERSLESSRGEAHETLEFIEGDLERLKRDLDESERKFRKFEEEHMEELPGNENSILPKLYIAKSELAEIDREIMGLNEKLKFLEEEDVITVPNPKLADLNDRITNLELELTGSRARYYDNHPRIIQMQKELVHLNKVLEEESEKVITEEKIVNNPMYESILERGFEMRLELRSLRSHRKEIESTIARFKPTLENIPALKQTLFELGTDYNINKKLYEDRLLQKSKAVLVKEMSLDAKSSPFNIVEPPRISYAPLRMVKIKIIMMGFLMGIGLGIGLVFGLEQIDQRFKTVDEIQDYLQIPALGVIPTILTKEDSKKEVYRKAG
jgi:polysaccharide chain length determinant protein (PEP-CTERM system associated)